MVSDRLGSSVVANRMFPKVRSWFALGAPLELLSPLSVVRIVALVALVTWPLGALLGAVDPVAAAVMAAGTVAVIAFLSRVRTLSPRSTELVGFVVSAAAGVSLATEGGPSGRSRSPCSSRSPRS